MNSNHRAVTAGNMSGGTIDSLMVTGAGGPGHGAAGGGRRKYTGNKNFEDSEEMPSQFDIT